MTDTEHVHQALRELRDIVKCRCHEAYTGRGLHDPDCECDSTDAVQTVTDAITSLTEQLAAARRDAKEAEACLEEKWQPIETAPRDGTEVLLWDPREDYICTGRCYSNVWRFWGGLWLVDPTHWMPLPDPPKETDHD